MKTIFTTLIFLFTISAGLYGQNYYLITFDGTGVNENNGGHKLMIDLAGNPSNMWEIGVPQKTIFTNTASPTKAIVTKTMTTYPVNNTSSFMIKHVADFGFAWNVYSSIGGKYFVNSDTITDFGTIEFSPDNGATWVDLVSNTTYSNNIFWNNPYTKPVLNGNSGTWKTFHVNIQGLGPVFSIQYGDTVIYKFTFTSDGSQTNKDGLMFDSIFVQDNPPLTIMEEPSSGYLKFYPNPSYDFLNIVYDSSAELEGKLSVYNALGEMIIEKPVSLSGKPITLQIKDLKEGFYTYKIIGCSGDQSFSGTFVKVGEKN
jgi:hypothetical protein